MTASRFLIAFACTLACCSLSFAGGSIFSGNGLGEQLSPGGARTAGLGGAGIGWRDSLSWHSANPALSGFGRRSSFRVGGYVGVWNTTANGKTDSDAETVWKDWRLYFPIAKKWAVGIGAEPLFRADVQTFERKTADYGQGNEQTYVEHDVFRGGDLALHAEGSFRMNAMLSAGLALKYHLYRFEREQSLNFDTAGYRDVSYSDVATYRGWAPTFGVHAQVTENTGVGLLFTPRSSGNWENDFSKSDDDSVITTDRSGDWPGEFGLGVSHGIQDGWTSVVDFSIGMWEKGDLGILYDQGFQKSPETPIQVSGGVERKLTRDVEANAGWDAYRLGVYFRRNYWPHEPNTADDPPAVEDLGVALGTSMFVSKGAGRIHGALEAGLRGMNEELQGAKENFVRFHLQVEMSEQWFQRARPRGLK